MEFIQSIVIEVPLWQAAVLLLIMTACLAFGRNVLGLSMAILSVMYWCYIVNFHKFYVHSFSFNSYSLSFLLIGGINALLVVVIFIYTFSIKE